MKKIIKKIVVVRSYYAGNWAGIVNDIDEKNGMIELTGAYRLWNWTAKNGISLSEVAQFGVKAGKICKPVPSVWLNLKDCYELIEATNEAFETIKEQAK